MHGDRAEPLARPSRPAAGGRAPRRSSRRSRAARGARGLLVEQPAASSSPWVHEVASTTTGSSPSPVQRHRRSTVSFAMRACAAAIALRAPGRRRSSVPATSAGIQTGMPGAVRDRDQRRGQAGPPARSPRGAAEDPVDAGRQVDGGGAARAVARQRRRGRRSASASTQAGTSSVPTRGSRRARDRAAGRAVHRRTASPRAASAARERALDAGPSGSAPRSAARSAARGPCCGGAQLLDELAGVDPERAGERAAAVGRAGLEAVVVVLLEQRARAPASPAGWRAISRRRTIRCRGVVVRSRLGQTGSQKPHSTQVVADLLDLAAWSSGSRGGSRDRG